MFHAWLFLYVTFMVVQLICGALHFLLPFSVKSILPLLLSAITNEMPKQWEQLCMEHIITYHPGCATPKTTLSA